MRARVASHDLGGLLARSGAARDAALGVVAHNVLADCTPYVPVETGALRESGEPRQDGDGWVVEWGTTPETAEYARYQYYTPGLNHDTNANAAGGGGEGGENLSTDHWFDKARSVRGESWRDMYASEYEGRLHG